MTLSTIIKDQKLSKQEAEKLRKAYIKAMKGKNRVKDLIEMPFNLILEDSEDGAKAIQERKDKEEAERLERERQLTMFNN